MVFEAWDDYWRRTPGVKRIVVKGIRDPASRLAGLQTGELDLAYGMTGKLLPRVMKDKKLRWDENFTAPWYLLFPGYAEKDSPFHDKRVRQAVSLAINRAFISKRETQGIGIPWGNWINAGNPDALRGDGKDLPVPEDLQERLGVSYLFIAHDLAAVSHLSQRTAVMYLGKLVEVADSLSLCKEPLHPYTKALFAASLPSHPDEPREEIVLSGEVPSALNPPSGCHFHPRCPFAMARCREEEPVLTELSPGHSVACHLY
jgi:oligopeptide/dipeptide ABC transporter ATP-binding protein